MSRSSGVPKQVRHVPEKAVNVPIEISKIRERLKGFQIELAELSRYEKDLLDQIQTLNGDVIQTRSQFSNVVSRYLELREVFGLEEEFPDRFSVDDVLNLDSKNGNTSSES
jgi:hypothetical protein